MSSLVSPAVPSTTEPSSPFAPRPRCQHLSRNHRPCRYLAVSTTQPFCKHHLPEGSPEHFSHLLHTRADNFDTPGAVTNTLHSIFFALADNQISERRAGVLTYILQTILNSQRANLQLQKLVATSEREGLSVDNPFSGDDSSPNNAPLPHRLTWNLPPIGFPRPSKPPSSASADAHSASPGTSLSRVAGPSCTPSSSPTSSCTGVSSDPCSLSHTAAFSPNSASALQSAHEPPPHRACESRHPEQPAGIARGRRARHSRSRRHAHPRLSGISRRRLSRPGLSALRESRTLARGDRSGRSYGLTRVPLHLNLSKHRNRDAGS